jgi:hypothetical protein
MSLFSTRSSSQLLIAAAYCIMQGCSVRVPDGKFRCDELTSCPGDLECRSGFCHSKTSTSDENLMAKEMSPEGGPRARDADPPPSEAAADGGSGGHSGSGDTAGSGGASGASETGEGGSDAGAMDTPVCVLGEASLGACVLP